MYSQPELIYSIACSAYVVTCLMFAAVRWFHVCPGAKENSTTVQLFRSRRTCTAGLVDRSKIDKPIIASKNICSLMMPQLIKA